jgi:hypothetical protein
MIECDWFCQLVFSFPRNREFALIWFIFASAIVILSQDRVKHTALAFCASLLQTATPGAGDVGGTGTSIESMRVPPGTLHESTALDDMLDGVAAAKDKMEAAKAKIQQVRLNCRFQKLCVSANPLFGS